MKRNLLWLVTALFLGFVHLAEAQQAKKVPRVAFLSLPSSGPDLRSEAFRQGLCRDFGYTERQNIVVEYRWADGKIERLAGLAAELVGMKPDVIVTASTACGTSGQESDYDNPRRHVRRRRCDERGLLPTWRGQVAILETRY
jgi:putative ABC transport system substrate-binding protein